MIPFVKWLENLSEPQHRLKEKDGDLDSVVEGKLKEIMMDLEPRASRIEVLKSMQRIIGSTMKKDDKEQSQLNQNLNAPGGPAPVGPAPGAGDLNLPQVPNQ